MTDDERWIRRAIALGRQNPGSPIGCVIVRDGQVLAEGHNEVDPNHDPTAHAEITCIRRACAALADPQLAGATLYTTLQPCGMCSMASIWAKIGRIVYGAERHQVHRMYFEDRHLEVMDYIRDAYRDDMVLQGGVLAEECAALYYGPDDTPPAEEQANV